MKTLDIAEATGELRTYAPKVRSGPLVVTRRGRPVMAVVSVDADDVDSLQLAHDSGFVALIEKSRKVSPPGQGVPLEAVRTRFGLRARARRAPA